jgi:hypothetical protein
MKKAAVAVLLVTASISPLFSQYHHISSDEQLIDYSSNFYRWGLYKNAIGNQKITISGKNGKGKLVSVKSNDFNKDTLVTSFQYKDGKGREKVKTLSSYKEKRLVGKEVFKKGALKYKTENTYDGRYKTSYAMTNASGVVLFKTENIFTDKEYQVVTMNKNFPIYKGKKLKSTIIYKKGGSKQKNKWIYEYDTEGKQALTTYYNGKNDVKFVWDYTCKEEGKLVKKNQTNFCKWQESKDGMLIEVTRRTSPKGKIQKTIKKYDVDTNLLAMETYMDDVIYQKVNYDKNFSKPLFWENYKKGVLKYRYIYEYADNGKVLTTKSFRGKDLSVPSYEEKFNYEGEKLVAVENYSKGKLLRSYEVVYN